ncbi:hypothetical protein MtrunA17_Chr6g0484371 [Medicago truncatula]|uniref:Uncharacterized protein n=1 Tax=Medicago truncatula TaxID=3880 RepID=A0A396HN59_MEDTR|nr:hypothetical protein MtrunA17_Chr6g0484371 [Medicago truncatula]
MSSRASGFEYPKLSKELTQEKTNLLSKVALLSPVCFVSHF